MALVELKDGRVIRVENVEQHLVSQEDLQAQVNELTARLSQMNSLLTNSPTITITGTDGSYQAPVEQPAPPADVVDAPAAPAEPAPAADPQPQPAPVDQGVPVPDVAAAPVEQPPLQ